MDKVSLSDKLARFSEQWSPRIVAEANGQYLKLAKVQGEFVEHAHADEDEVFLCLAGRFGLRLPDEGRTILLGPGELFVVPAGVRHAPFADDEAQILIFEPKQTAHTGEVQSERTRPVEEQPWI